MAANEDEVSITELGDMPRGWLCDSKENEDQRREAEGYSDLLGETYVWKADLANGLNVSSGDVIAIWDGRRLLGVSRIEGVIEEFESKRTRSRCPACKRADVRPLKSSSTKFACQQCAEKFDIPISEVVPTTYRVANYAAGWVPVEEFVGALECRKLALKFGSQHSLRQIDVGKLQALIQGLDLKTIAPFVRRNPEIYGGHILRTVRTRVGQNSFRKKLLKKFGSICAVSSHQPESVLDAAHLYSFSEVGVHHDNGGLLLRKDIHKLFDRGSICINPDTCCVDADDDILEFSTYAALHGRKVEVALSNEELVWLRIHWEQNRPESAS